MEFIGSSWSGCPGCSHFGVKKRFFRAETGFSVEIKYSSGLKEYRHFCPSRIMGMDIPAEIGFRIWLILNCFQLGV